MPIPDDFTPSVTSARRYRFLREKRAGREGEGAAEILFRALRLDTYGTPFPPDFPARAALLAGDVRCVEEARGAAPDELRSYGLTLTQAEAVINRLDTDTDLDPMPTFQSGPRAGQSYEQDDVTLASSAERSATGDGDEYELGDRGTLRLALDVTAASGTTPTLHVQVQTRALSSDTWRTVGAFPIVSATGTTYREFTGCNRYVRTQHTLAGTSPVFTFSVSGNAV